MPARTAFELDNGGTVFIEPAAGAGVAPAGRSHLERAATSLRESLAPVIGAASDVLTAFAALPAGPEEIEVQFGVMLDATVGAVIVTGTAGAHLDVTLRWRPGAVPDPKPDPDPKPTVAPGTAPELQRAEE